MFFSLSGSIGKPPLSHRSRFEGKRFPYPCLFPQPASPLRLGGADCTELSAPAFPNNAEPSARLFSYKWISTFPVHTLDTKSCCGISELGQASSELGKHMTQMLVFCRFSESIVPGFGGAACALVRAVLLNSLFVLRPECEAGPGLQVPSPAPQVTPQTQHCLIWAVCLQGRPIFLLLTASCLHIRIRHFLKEAWLLYMMSNPVCLA